MKLIAVLLLCAASLCDCTLIPCPARAEDTPDVVWKQTALAGIVQSVAFTPDGQTLMASGIKLFSLPDGAYQRTIAMPRGLFAMSPDGQSVLTTDSHSHALELWRVSDGVPICTFNGPTRR